MGHGPFSEPEPGPGPVAPPSAEAPAVQGPPTEIEELRVELERLRAAAADKATLAERERALLKAVLEQSPQGILVCDAQGQLALRNAAAERIWAGSAKPEDAGWGLYEAFHPDGRPYEPGDWATLRVLRTRQPVAAEETLFRRFDGTHGTLLGSCAPLVGSEGLLLGSAWVFTDITHLKQIETENALLLQERTRFLSMVSHELSNVVTPLSIHLQLLQDQEGLPAKARESVDVLRRNAERLDLLLQDVMEVSRLQTGRLTVQKHPLELGGLLVEAVESFRELARQQSVAFDWQGAPGLVVDADPKRITQVLFNLLSNALKFTPPGGRVSVELASEQGKAVVHVRDTGAGIPPEHVPKLFRPFSQAPQVGGAQRGSGLGLYISRGIIELHGGRIWCESPGVGKGATFSFELPRVDPFGPMNVPPETLDEAQPSEAPPPWAR